MCLGGAVAPLPEWCFSASKNPDSVGSAGVAPSSLAAHLGSIRKTCSVEHVGPAEGTSSLMCSRHTDNP